MSSYLNFYLKTKECKKPLRLMTFSRNTQIYRSMTDDLNIVWAGDDEKYTDITEDDIRLVLISIKDEIHKAKRIREENEKIHKETAECLNNVIPKLQDTKDVKRVVSALYDVISEKYHSNCSSLYDEEYIEEMESTKHLLEMLSTIMEDIPYSDFDGLCCNIS